MNKFASLAYMPEGPRLGLGVSVDSSGHELYSHSLQSIRQLGEVFWPNKRCGLRTI